MSGHNPLESYYRQTKSYITLPSGNEYYSSDVLELTESGEVGIRAMSSKDELLFKNPDALLNGEALKNALLSCVVGLKKPESLLTNDVDALNVAIRHVSYGANTEIDYTCPECEHDNEFTINLESLLSTATKLDSEYPVNLDNGLTVFVKPFTFSDKLKTIKKGFEQQKTAKLLDDEYLDELEKLKVFSKTFDELTKLNYELLANSIVKVINSESDLELINDASNLKNFKEMLENLDVSDADKIDTQVKVINDIGVTKTINAKCKECEHEWEEDIELNPVNFSTES